MLTGVVKWFSETKGFGFIESASSQTGEKKDYFVYFKEIQSPGFKTLKEGQKVQFNAASSPKGPCAQGVTVVD